MATQSAGRCCCASATSRSGPTPAGSPGVMANGAMLQPGKTAADGYKPGSLDNLTRGAASRRVQSSSGVCVIGTWH